MIPSLNYGGSASLFLLLLASTSASASASAPAVPTALSNSNSNSSHAHPHPLEARSSRPLVALSGIRIDLSHNEATHVRRREERRRGMEGMEMDREEKRRARKRKSGRTRARSTEGNAEEEEEEEKEAWSGGEWMLREKKLVAWKYQGHEDVVESTTSDTVDFVKRADSPLTLANQQWDASYSASVSIGTPSQTFDIALDTGSSDLWVLGSTCQSSACNGYTLFDSSRSSTFKNDNTPFSIRYGSGSSAGTLGTDKVTMGGFSVMNQKFAVVNSMSDGLITQPLSGLMGLAFQSLASSGATPWWVTLATGTSSAWSDPLFGFYLKRYRDVASALSTEPDGGIVTLGYTDPSLYSGDITYISVTGTQYWNIPIGGITVGGKSISLGSQNAAAIDTGTTLIGGPSSAVAAIYAAIPGSKPMTGGYEGYYEYPCSTKISMIMTFGGLPIEITDADFNIGSYSSDSNMCTGGVYVQTLASSSPIQWVVGDTLLKNVYSVYRYSPAAVGFARLSTAESEATRTVATAIHTMSNITPLGSATGSASASASVTTATGSATSANGTSTTRSASGASTSSNTATTSQSTGTSSIKSDSNSSTGSATSQSQLSTGSSSASPGLPTGTGPLDDGSSDARRTYGISLAVVAAAAAGVLAGLMHV